MVSYSNYMSSRYIKCVLILVVVEDGLVLKMPTGKELEKVVLILVVVEDGLVQE